MAVYSGGPTNSSDALSPEEKELKVIADQLNAYEAKHGAPAAFAAMTIIVEAQKRVVDLV